MDLSVEPDLVTGADIAIGAELTVDADQGPGEIVTSGNGDNVPVQPSAPATQVVTNALDYLDRVKTLFGDKSRTFKGFLSKLKV